MAITQRRVTEEEFLRLPDDGRKYELVDGEAKEVPAGVRHDEIVARIIFLLYPFARGRGALCGSQAGYRMLSGNVRSPDVSFTLRERLPGGEAPVGFGDVAPDLCVEILSPSEDSQETDRKLREYFSAGASEVWHVLPEAQQMVVYRAPTSSRMLGSEDRLHAGSLLPGFACQVKELFDLG